MSGNVQDKKGNELIRALNALRQQGVAPLVGCVQQQPRGHAQAFEKHETRRKTHHTTTENSYQIVARNVGFKLKITSILFGGWARQDNAAPCLDLW